ncbi:MAG: hypothetical protein ACLRSW_04470 [Christensenellaceae bacterium]
MEQLRIETTEKITSCAFTGHRRLGEDFDPERLKKEIESCVSRESASFTAAWRRALICMRPNALWN